MEKMNMSSNFVKSECVKQQYSDDKNLSARIDLHTKHSTNKQGFFAWLWEQYNFPAKSQILELGCGNGAQWQDKADALPDGCAVVLSDFSDGMVSAVKEKYSKYKAFSFKQVDIQAIDFPNETFDIVIANHMLYHVPDLTRALTEVWRVLKPGGKFYSTTIGSGGLSLFLHEAFKRFNPDTKAFTQQWSFVLQNGYEILSEHFSDVQRFDYEDSLAVTETKDLMNWIKSTASMSIISEEELDKLYECFEKIRKNDGAINIPKEAGLFISIK
jgi:ubiquinone/menaquinone biosynthesis C-methylase UbiE